MSSSRQTTIATKHARPRSPSLKSRGAPKRTGSGRGARADKSQSGAGRCTAIPIAKNGSRTGLRWHNRIWRPYRCSRSCTATRPRTPRFLSRNVGWIQASRCVWSGFRSARTKDRSGRPRQIPRSRRATRCINQTTRTLGRSHLLCCCRRRLRSRSGPRAHRCSSPATAPRLRPSST